jgi:hypothetical protein
MDPTRISRAVVLWTGWGQTMWPQRSEERLANALGAHEAELLMPHVRAWEEDLYRSEARKTAPTLDAMGTQAEADFKAVHPEAADFK